MEQERTLSSADAQPISWDDLDNMTKAYQDWKADPTQPLDLSDYVTYTISSVGGMLELYVSCTVLTVEQVEVHFGVNGDGKLTTIFVPDIPASERTDSRVSYHGLQPYDYGNAHP